MAPQLLDECSRQCNGASAAGFRLFLPAARAGLGVSRMTIYRRRKQERAKNHPDVTGVSAAIFLSGEDRPVTPAGVEGLSEGHFVSKKECPRSGRGVAATVGASGLTSSQTATTMAADIPISAVPCWVFGRSPVSLAKVA